MASKFGNEFFVYRYTDKKTRQVVYIGKTNCSLKARVDAHKREEAFAPYDCIVDCVELSNQVETDSVEKFLINYYKPPINLKDNIPFLTGGMELSGLNWMPYEEYLLSLKKNVGRRNVLLSKAREAERFLDDILASGDRRTVLSGVFSPVLFDLKGMFNPTEKHVERNGNGYRFSLLPGMWEEVERRYSELLYCAYRPALLLWDISSTYAEQFALCEDALSLVKELEEFAVDGYQQDEESERFLFSSGESKRTAFQMFFVKAGTNASSPFHGKFFAEWAYENGEALPSVTEDICRKLCVLMKQEGIIQIEEDATANFGYLVKKDD